MEVIEEAVGKCGQATRRQKSFFAKRLEHHLENKGINVPGRVLLLLDTPFDDFTPEYTAMYEKKVKGQALFHVFSDMLVEIYQQLDADKLGWETAVDYLPDSPMRICAADALNRINRLEEMERGESGRTAEDIDGTRAMHVTPSEQKFGVQPYSCRTRGRWWKRDDEKLAGSGSN